MHLRTGAPTAPLRLRLPCHCEPVRRLVWQSVPRREASGAFPSGEGGPKGRKRRVRIEPRTPRRGGSRPSLAPTNRSAHGSASPKTTMSLRTSPQTGVAIRSPARSVRSLPLWGRWPEGPEEAASESNPAPRREAPSAPLARGAVSVAD